MNNQGVLLEGLQGVLLALFPKLQGMQNWEGPGNDASVFAKLVNFGTKLSVCTLLEILIPRLSTL